jgi:hypothetical protein
MYLPRRRVANKETMKQVATVLENEKAIALAVVRKARGTILLLGFGLLATRPEYLPQDEKCKEAREADRVAVNLAASVEETTREQQ